MDILQTIAANLNSWMEAHSTLNTIKKVAAKSGVGFGTVQRVKNGDGNPTITNLLDIARAFGHSLEDILRPAGNGAEAEIISLGVTESDAPNYLAAPLNDILIAARHLTREGQFVLLGRAEELANRYGQNKQVN